MNSPKIINLNYTYKKPGAEVWVLNLDDIPIDKSKIRDQQIVHLAPQSIGGNHRHSRTEWFIGIGDLVLIWLDSSNKKHEIKMNPHGQIKLITIPPLLAHAVVNRSKDQDCFLFEIADEKMNNVEKVELA